MMYKNNGYQGSGLLNSSNRVAANVYGVASDVKEYLLLKDENEKLARENAMLYNFLKTGYAVVPRKVFVKNDTIYKQQYSFVSAKAVNSTVNRRSNYLTINVGEEHGIKRDMAVMNSEGAVGIVKDVSANFASVLSFLHKDSRVNCQLKRDGSYGPLVWDGSDYRYCSLRDLPTRARIKRGDTVITSERSGIFPGGIPVGIVESFEQKHNDPFFTARVKLFADFKKLNYVFVIKNKFKEERDSLEKASQVQDDK